MPEYRMIDGRKYKVIRLPEGNAGRSISKQYFGGKKSRSSRSIRTEIGEKESSVERLALEPKGKYQAKQ